MYARHKTYLWLLLLLLLSGIVYWLSPSGIPARQVAQVQVQGGDQPPVDEVLAQAQAAVSEAGQSLLMPVPAEPLPAAPAAIAWELKAAPDQPVLPLPEAVSIYEYVYLDMENPALPDVGDNLQMPLPGAEAAQVRVTRRTQLGNGDYSWSGYLEGQGTDYPVVMTYGANSAFATITTPQGSYSLESINGQGWVYKNPAAEELSHPGVSDYMDIPDHHH